MKTAIDANIEVGTKLYVQNKVSGPTLMNNMPQFKCRIDYTGMQNLKPGREVTVLFAYHACPFAYTCYRHESIHVST